jgi:hypothetical protein
MAVGRIHTRGRNATLSELNGTDYIPPIDQTQSEDAVRDIDEATYEVKLLIRRVWLVPQEDQVEYAYAEAHHWHGEMIE